ncbi:MAG: ammonium transporter [Bryobacteraceae bacterium]
MSPAGGPPYSETTAALVTFLIFLVPLAAAGVALIHTGLSRSRSAAHTMLASLSVAAAAALVYGVCGFAWQGAAGESGHMILVGGKTWGWIGGERFFLRGLTASGLPAAMVACFGVFAAGLCALIPLGAGADRWRLGAALASTAFVAGLMYPLFAHWTWSGGWLSALGVNYGLGHGYVDLAGAGGIHALGGMSALALCWMLGPRRSKYTLDGMPVALPGHNTVLVLAGCLLAWTGWLGLNGAGALLFGGLSASALPLVGVNTTFAAAAAALTAAAVTRIRFRRPDASLCANGWVGGLVASSGACAFFTPFAAVFVGAVAGLLIPLSVEWLDIYLELDDPGGAISVYGVGGLWGMLATGMLADVPGSGNGQFLAQIVGISTILGFALPVFYGWHWCLNRVYPQRVSDEGERQGLDLHELGAGAYPEFVIHREDFSQR